eukprot:CAMPEP_0185854090 /NCGR_PEP_ID=MMETSP1354-20130828/21280_1 /TAXON_ID=708628 /ORGANISM="Erythrolobus madagascarensis, Strain CCMP3276" /LENGTH=339 /DNA_ID=CAMNT_0028555769 /DNA_START=58 /DNA_END=1077 /DNA_ORIENTATION=+
MRLNVEGFGFSRREDGVSSPMPSSPRRGDVIRSEIEVTEEESVPVLVARFCEAAISDGQLGVNVGGPHDEQNSPSSVAEAIGMESIAVVYAGRIMRLDAQPPIQLCELGLTESAVVRVVRTARSTSQQSSSTRASAQTESASILTTAHQSRETSEHRTQTAHRDRAYQTQQQQQQPRSDCNRVEVREVTPNGCLTSGGVRVMVIGHGFVEGARVRFGRCIVPAVRHSHDLLVCVAPPHEAGVVSLEVERTPEPIRLPRVPNGKSPNRAKKRNSTKLVVYQPLVHDSSFTSSGTSFTYIDIGDLQGALALTCDSGSKKLGQETTCNTEEQTQVQTPHGLS